MASKLNLSPPWLTYYHEIEAMFKQDPEIKVHYDEEDCEVKLYVDNADKAYALSVLIPPEKEFGNVTLKVTVIPANTPEKDIDIFEKAFRGNPVLNYIRGGAGPFGDINYAVFQNKVVQFFNDDISDAHGVKSTLYQDIAKDIFGLVDGVFFCTDVEDGVGKPLGEWP